MSSITSSQLATSSGPLVGATVVNSAEPPSARRPTAPTFAVLPDKNAETKSAISLPPSQGGWDASLERNEPTSLNVGRYAPPRFKRYGAVAAPMDHHRFRADAPQKRAHVHVVRQTQKVGRGHSVGRFALPASQLFQLGPR